MATPSPRNSIRIARGLYADLLASIADLGIGELCYGIDHDKFYTPDGQGGLAEVGRGTAIATLGQVGDVDLAGLQSGQVLKWNGASWVPGEDSSAVSSVAGKTGDVTLVLADITDFDSSDYATAAQGLLADSALQPGANVSELVNDAGYITSADIPGSPVLSVNGETGEVVLDAADVGAIAPGQVNPVYFADQAAFPDATVNHGAVAHSHADGAMYFAHGGTWNKLANSADIPSIDPNTVTTDSVPTFTVTVETTERTITAGAFDLATGNHWTCGAITVPAPTNATAGTSGLIRITAGPVVWNSVFKFPGGAAPTIGAFPAIVPFYVQSGSEILMGNVAEGIA